MTRRTAARLARVPAAMTRSSVRAREGHGTSAWPPSRCGLTATSAEAEPTATPAVRTRPFLGHHEPGERSSPESDRLHGGQLATAFEQVPQQDDRQPQRAQQQAESAKGLEGTEVGVLDGLESLQALGGGNCVEAEAAERAFQFLHRAVLLARRCSQQEVGGTGATREVLRQVRFGDHELALEDALAKQPDQPEFQGVAAFRFSILIPWPQSPSEGST